MYSGGDREILAKLRALSIRVEAIFDLINGVTRIKRFGVTVDPPTKQGEVSMANVTALGAPVVQPMMDDQQTTMHLAPQHADGSPATLNSSQPLPVFAALPAGFVTLTPDATGLSCAIVGVKNAAGLPASVVVTATYTNADSTVATGSATFDMTQDPNEADVQQFGVTVDAPTAQ